MIHFKSFEPYHDIQYIYFRLIRLEFNQQHLNYYTELDAVILYGKPVQKMPSVEQKNPVGFGDSDVSVTAHLFRQLSLTEEKEDLRHNGFFDILPVRILCFSCVFSHNPFHGRIVLDV